MEAMRISQPPSTCRMFASSTLARRLVDALVKLNIAKERVAPLALNSFNPSYCFLTVSPEVDPLQRLSKVLSSLTGGRNVLEAVQQDCTRLYEHRHRVRPNARCTHTVLAISLSNNLHHALSNQSPGDSPATVGDTNSQLRHVPSIPVIESVGDLPNTIKITQEFLDIFRGTIERKSASETN